MPAAFEWVSKVPADHNNPPLGVVHIRPAADANTTDLNIIKIVHALGELGAENVGPGVVAKLYAAGFHSVGAIYAASPENFVARVEGCKDRLASKIFEGLRAAESTWTELHFIAASSTMPRTVGHTKIAAVLAVVPTPANWHTLAGTSLPGLSVDTIQQMINAVPAYLAWRAENLSWVTPISPVSPVAASGRIFVMTGTRDTELTAELLTRGDQIGASINKKTTALVYPDGPEPSSSKVTKAKELGIPVLNTTEFRKMFLNP
jgi:NAD-dependent DNA ligase